jgi:hypothetical protein
MEVNVLNNIVEVKTIRFDDIDIENEDVTIGTKIVNKLLIDGWILLDIYNGYFFLGKPRKTNICSDLSSKTESR